MDGLLFARTQPAPAAQAPARRRVSAWDVCGLIVGLAVAAFGALLVVSDLFLSGGGSGTPVLGVGAFLALAAIPLVVAGARGIAPREEEEECEPKEHSETQS